MTQETVYIGETIWFMEGDAIRTSKVVGAAMREDGTVIVELACGRRMENQTACRSMRQLFAQLSRDFRERQKQTLL